MAERMIEVAAGVQLCAEAFGAEDAPVVLLVGGAAMAMDHWDEEFCRRIAAGGRRVVRYDNRDTGRSTCWPAGKPGYTGADLVTDAVAVLDGFGADRAHVAGISMGGGIGQELAVRHAGRLLSLALLSTSAALPGGPPHGELPPPAERVRSWFDHPPPEPDWSDREAVMAWMVAAERAFAGSIPPDEPALRAMIGQVIDRSRDIAAASNHWVMIGGEDDAPAPGTFADIAVPTLVIHGTDDPLFPLAHGEALAAAIPGARLLAVQGMGHQVPPPETWDVVVPALVEHTRARS